MPRTKSPKKRSLLKDMKIDEVSLVGRGANPDAHVSIFKSEDIDEVLKRSFADAVESMGLREDLMKMFQEMMKYKSALRESLYSILTNPEYPNKKMAMKESIGQFMNVMTSMIDDSEIIKHVQEVTKDQEVETVGKEETEAICVEMRKAYADANPGKELPNVKKEDQEEVMKEKELNILKTMAEMNDVEKEFWNGLDEEEQESLLKQDMDPRMMRMREMMDRKKKKKQMMPKKEMKDKGMGGYKKSDDESFEMDGATIYKSDVGDTAFHIMKAQNNQTELLRKELADTKDIAKQEREKRVEKEFADRAHALWPNLPGTPMEKGKILRNIEEMPEDLQKVHKQMLSAKTSDNEALFKEYGANGEPTDDSPTEKLNKMAKQHAEKENINFFKAYDAILQTDEGRELYEKSTSPR